VGIRRHGELGDLSHRAVLLWTGIGGVRGCGGVRADGERVHEESPSTPSSGLSSEEKSWRSDRGRAGWLAPQLWKGSWNVQERRGLGMEKTRAERIGGCAINNGRALASSTEQALLVLSNGSMLRKYNSENLRPYICSTLLASAWKQGLSALGLVFQT